MSWLSDQAGRLGDALSVAWSQATQAAQVAAAQTAQASQIAASQALSASQQVASAAAPILEQGLPIVASAVPGLGSLAVSAFKHTNTNISDTRTDSSVHVGYADNRIAASEGSIVNAGGSLTLSNQNDPSGYGFGGQVMDSVMGATPAADAVPAGSVAAATLGTSRWWIYAAIGLAVVGAFLFLRRRRK